MSAPDGGTVEILTKRARIFCGKGSTVLCVANSEGLPKTRNVPKILICVALRKRKDTNVVGVGLRKNVRVIMSSTVLITVADSRE